MHNGNDIVEILRDQHNHDEVWLRYMCLTAATEIEILRKKNQELYKDAVWLIQKAREAAETSRDAARSSKMQQGW